MRSRQRTTISIALTLALLGALTACGQQEGDVDTDLVTSAPTAAAPAEAEPTTEAAEETTEAEPTEQATEEETTEAQTTDAEPTGEETTEQPEPTQPPVAAAYPQEREAYVDALLEAWSSGDGDAIDALSSDEAATVGHCIAGGADWTRYTEEGTGPFDLSWAGFPGLLMASASPEGGGQAWIYLDATKLGGPDAVIGTDVGWQTGTVDVDPGCFAHDLVDALETWAEGDPSVFEAMLAPDQPTTLDELEDWGYANGGHELGGLWGFGDYEDIPADLVVLARSAVTGDDQPPPLLVIDPEVIATTTDGSITRATITVESRRF